MRCIKAFVLLLLLPALAGAEGVLTPAANPPVPVVVISTSGIPFIKASSGSIGNNCAITSLTALPRTFSGGAYIYLPANAISAGSSAGWYWFVGSSTTAGTCYNSTYTSGTPTVGTTTAFSTTGPGAFVGSTADITAVSISIPANFIGGNGRIETEASHSFTNNANGKFVRVKLGATDCYAQSSTSIASNLLTCSISNRGVATIQSMIFRYSTSGGSGAATQQTTDGAIDTSAATTLSIVLTTNGAATDNLILEGYRFVAYRGQ